MAKNFTQRHYNALATSLHESYSEATVWERNGIERAAKNLATMLRADNPRFNAERWFEAIYEGKGI